MNTLLIILLTLGLLVLAFNLLGRLLAWLFIKSYIDL